MLQEMAVANPGLTREPVPQVEPETQSVIIATTDLRGSIQAGSTIVAYATDQLNNLGSAVVKGFKQVWSHVLVLIPVDHVSACL